MRHILLYINTIEISFLFFFKAEHLHELVLTNGILVKCIKDICTNHILEPLCTFASPHPYKAMSKINSSAREMLQLQDYNAQAELHLSEISLQCRVSNQMCSLSPLFLSEILEMLTPFFTDGRMSNVPDMGKQCKCKRGSWYSQGITT
jgi:hypothetical protein